MSNPTPYHPPKIDTLEKIKAHIGIEAYTQFVNAMTIGLPVTKLESITGRKYSTNRQYARIWRNEHV